MIKSPYQQGREDFASGIPSYIIPPYPEYRSRVEWAEGWMRAAEDLVRAVALTNKREDQKRDEDELPNLDEED